MNAKMLGCIGLLVLVAAALGLVMVRQNAARPENEVLVLCGGSMRAALEAAKAAYEKNSQDTIVTTYGGSGELCAQIQNTGKGDIYICHDPFMPWASDKGLISQWCTLASLEVVIIVPKGNAKGIEALQDLARPGLRVGIGNQIYSSSGQIVKYMLAAQDYGQDVLKNVRVETKGHQQRCNDVVMGTLDAAIVWNAVAVLYQDKVDILPIPKSYVDTITSATFGVVDLTYTKVTAGMIASESERPAAKRFYHYLATEGKALFAELGFSPVREPAP
ncbi:MAG: substrate-binding domain-containing protein [Phycisphaerae bacterium]|nr:substrate-binding domain-containing protein [Phycisphaerae bacterium]